MSGDIGIYLNRGDALDKLRQYKVFSLQKSGDIYTLIPVSRAQYVAVTKSAEGLVSNPDPSVMLAASDERSNSDYA